MSGAAEQAMFFGKFGRLMEGGVPMLRAFETALGAVTDRDLSEALSRVLERAWGGTSLADACAEEPGVFGREVLCLLAEGERMGDVERKAAAIAAGLSAGEFGEGDERAAREALAEVLRVAADAGARAVHLDASGAFLRAGGVLRPAMAGAPGPALLRAAVGRGPVFEVGGLRVRVVRGEGPDAGAVLHLVAAAGSGIGRLGLAAADAERLREWLARGPGIVLVAAADRWAAAEGLAALAGDSALKGRRVVTREAGGAPGAWMVPEGAALADLDPDVVVVEDIGRPGDAAGAAEALRCAALVLAGASEDRAAPGLRPLVRGRVVAAAGTGWEARGGPPPA